MEAMEVTVIHFCLDSEPSKCFVSMAKYDLTISVCHLLTSVCISDRPCLNSLCDLVGSNTAVLHPAALTDAFRV